MFLAGCIFGALACFGRADYNLPLYAFLYVMWDQDDNDKVMLMLLIAITFLGDLLWLFYWCPHWWSTEMGKVQAGMHNFVILCSFANFLLKLIVMGTLATVNKADLQNRVGQIQNQLAQK